MDVVEHVGEHVVDCEGRGHDTVHHDELLKYVKAIQFKFSSVQLSSVKLRICCAMHHITSRTSFVMTVYTPSPTTLSMCATLSSPVTDKTQSPVMTVEQ